ncbi:ArsR/SmtB family transcription factor [Falsihalocynthiibacter sp. S25ZX9]|uniref:ArsR/SmtB family transcription factor n=1 Tax=Falsihalocynthiibacter sp. S25ZX9 TaxID=3240870 RepID=UPI00350FAF52
MKPISYEATTLDAVFSALSDPTRRAILARLAHGEATVKELAAPFNVSQPAISKHLKILENTGLIARGQIRQSRPAYLRAEPMKEAMNWLTEFRRFWGVSFDQLDHLLETLNDDGKDTHDHE